MNEQIARAAPALPLASYKQAAFGFLGGFLAIGVISLLGHLTSSPLVIAPFGASSVLLFGAPDSACAQPRNLVFGHLLSTAVGLAVYWLEGPGVWQNGAVCRACHWLDAACALRASSGGRRSASDHAKRQRLHGILFCPGP